MTDIRIKMLKTVKAEIPPYFEFGFPGLRDTDLIAYKDRLYYATSNRNGAISAIIGDKLLGVKPDEFEFVRAPAWVLEKHGKLSEIMGRDRVYYMGKERVL